MGKRSKVKSGRSIRETGARKLAVETGASRCQQVTRWLLQYGVK